MSFAPDSGKPPVSCLSLKAAPHARNQLRVFMLLGFSRLLLSVETIEWQMKKQIESQSANTIAQVDERILHTRISHRNIPIVWMEHFREVGVELMEKQTKQTCRQKQQIRRAFVPETSTHTLALSSGEPIIVT